MADLENNHSDRDPSELEGARIFHGPATVGGIGWHLAEWQRNHHLISDCIVYDDRGFRQLHHVNMRIGDLSFLRKRIVMLLNFLSCLFRYDIFHFYSGQSFLPHGIDLPILWLFRKKVIMTYSGSEIRLIYILAKRNDFTHLCRVGVNHPKFDNKKKRSMRWQNLWINKFTAIRELHDYASEVIPNKKLIKEPWVNNIGFNVANLAEPHQLKFNDIPEIIHAPSSRGIKGSEHVQKAIELLKEKGLSFRYSELHGVPNDEVQKIIRNCDIVVDQFIIGELGTLAFEGMGHGKPVVSYLPPAAVEKHMPGCPVYNANIENLSERLEELINDPDLRIELGRQGIEFVRKRLDYETIQCQMIKVYADL